MSINNRYSLRHYILLVLLVLGSVVYAMPNMYGEDPAIQVSSKEGEPIGVDLEKQIMSNLVTQGIPYKSCQRTKNTILMRFHNMEIQLKAKDVIQKIADETRYSVALNLAPCTPKWLRVIGAKPMRLGLDLRGGIHFLLKINTSTIVALKEKRDFCNMLTTLCKAMRLYDTKNIILQKKSSIICFCNVKAREYGMSLLQKHFKDYQFIKIHQLGIQGILSKEVAYQTRKNTVNQVIAILRTRINELGVSESEIQQQGENYISVDLPGIQDTALAKDIIGKVATIALQLVDTAHNAQAIARTGTVPPGLMLYKYKGKPVLLKQEVILRGTSIASAVSTIGENGQPAVQVRVNGNEIPSFNRITKKNIGKPLAVVYVENQTSHYHLDSRKTTHRQIEKIINIATIQTTLGNNFQITNIANMEYANNLALLLRSGSYPVPVDFVQEKVIGPSLSQENIHIGITSIKVSVLSMIFFMAFYYRLFGVIADIALMLNIVVIIAILSILGATLTLPGIAGIVLTMSIALDANVLINERIREELRNSMSPLISIRTGYDRAFTTIVDSNVITLIVMAIVFALSSGSVQGFAVTTMIGLLSSMLTAIFFTRAIVNLIYERRSVSQLSIGIRVKKSH
ncbi:protein translocase subunit SecD [Coxiella-like endosymbiont of Amblyomma americanum]|uniref:protein translocase subunit SecD n=1 Tax=Coxiella-like endosymbiont of Amblyomma americanum TaxID=1987500 RepID=UPI000F89D865|nr:protein translocase subunit SecD [Coxiella-like endosymbiont of Amblyomma americanum]AUJ58929.1 protein translocase subunit SecD [Coxiella-like endosymbiont of Amblyomma americanum]